MAISNKPKYPKHLSCVFADGAATPETLTIPFSKGDCKLSGLRNVLNEPVKTEARGELIGVGTGKRVYATFTLSLFLTCFKAAAAPGPVIAFVLKSGTPYANLTSTYANGDQDTFTIDIQVTIAGIAVGDSADHTFTLHDCLLTDHSWEEAEDGMAVSLSFEVLTEISGDIALEQAEAA